MATTDPRNVDWPATDHETTAAAHEPDAAAPVPTPGRRLSRLAADLATAIRRMSEAARDAQLAHVADEAKGVSLQIQEQLAEGTAALRMRSEDDINEVREWVKAETARIKAESDTRIAGRKHLLDEQVASHAAATRDRIARLESVVTAYRETMDEFFRHFLAEEDPARLATIAEAMPEPPSLQPFLAPDVAWAGLANGGGRPMSAAEADAAEAEVEPAWSIDEAEAEAALSAAPVPEPVAEAPRATKAAAAPTIDAGAELKSTQIIVTGLVTVASVASFRRSLGRLPGVSTVTVTSAPNGDFLFHASHRRDVAFETSIPTLKGFVAEITGIADGAIFVMTLDPESER